MRIFETNRLYLKPLTIDFCTNTYLSWLNNPDSNKYLSNSKEWDYQRLEEYLKNIEQKKILSWAILIQNKFKHIGNIKIDPVNYSEKYGEYGILIGDINEWGKGYAFEASEKIIDYSFNELGLDKINLGVLFTNKNAIKLYEKLGFLVTNEIIDNNDNSKNHYRMSLRRNS